ncbi:MAG: methylamine utilization protein MauJ [Afipia sp.]
MKSALGIAEDGRLLKFTHPDNSYEVQLKERTSSDPADDHLSAYVFLEAATIKIAETTTKDALNSFLQLLSFVTGSSLRIVKRISLIDWSPGLSMRDMYAYGPSDKGWRIDALNDELVRTAQTFQECEISSPLKTSLRWFSAGLRAEVMDDQFQFFWYVVEILATTNAEKTKVADKCPRCGGDLHCEICNETPMHRPYEKQKIATVLQAQTSEKLAGDLFYIRNSLMHGTPREEIEINMQKSDPDFTFDKAVDIIGNVARTLIFRGFKVPPGQRQISMLEVNTYVNWTVTPKAHIQMGIPGDPNDPKIENVVLPEISVVFDERKSSPREQPVSDPQ